MFEHLSRHLARAIRRLAGVASTLAVLAGLGILAGPASAAGTVAPAWALRSHTNPTNLAPGAESSTQRGYELGGPEYEIRAVNVGGEASSGTYTITDDLPAGVTPGGRGPEPFAEQGGASVDLTCPTVTSDQVICTGSRAIRPGEHIGVRIPVDVAAGAKGELVNRVKVSGGGAAELVSGTQASPASASVPSFGFLPGAVGFSFDGATQPSGATATQAGSHPYRLDVALGFANDWFQYNEFLSPGGGLRSTTVELPKGYVVNPTATGGLCTATELEEHECPAASQVGTATVELTTNGALTEYHPLFNMVPPPGKPAEFGFDAGNGLGILVHIVGEVDVEGDYRLAAAASDILGRQSNPVLGVEVSLWGSPTAESHDGTRTEECAEIQAQPTCVEPTERMNKPFLTLPSACSGPQTITATARNWGEPSKSFHATAQSTDTNGRPVGITGCEKAPFRASLSMKPEVSTSDSPTGLEVDLHVPQNGEFENQAGEPQLATANLKDVSVTLPEGLVVNPSSAAGLAACTEAQFAEHGGAPAECPDASKIGSVEVDTPLLDHPLPGGVYVAEPYRNPFGSLLAIYVAVDDPRSGVVIKLAGKVEPDPTTGRLTTTFDENPELPFEDFRLDFFGGARAALRTPTTCGVHPYSSKLSPWSGTAPVDSAGSFSTGAAANGACASTEAGLPNTPSFQAGVTDPVAGAYSPFVVHLARGDGTQTIKGLNVNLPPGLLGKLAGIPYCPDAALATAASMTGAGEQASPSCPAASEVGKVTVGAGAGSRPYYVSGRAYLAGPYRGAPLSLAIITPAVAGPYDLGTVVVRSALYVNEETAQISVKSDPIPTILKGIPLDIRSISVEMDRHEFTRNPTNCEAMAIGGETISPSGRAATLGNMLQVGGCRDLGFRPKLKLRLKGATGRTGHPSLRAVVTMPQGGANIRRAQVNLPHAEFLDQGNIDKACTRPVLLAGNCPKSSIYGWAKAWTPLLAEPLQGHVYLVGGYGYKLPALVADLNGQVRITLAGKVDSGKNKGIRNTFEVVPDAPVSRFVLRMKGGKKYGLLENSENLCKAKKARRRAIVRFTGQNGKVRQWKPVVRNECGKKSSKHRRARGRKG